MAVLTKAIEMYHSVKDAYLKVINLNTEEKDYKGSHLKAIINFRKRKSDKAMAMCVVNLKVRYDEVKNRSEITIREYLTNKYLYNEGEKYLAIVDCLLVLAQAAVTLPSTSIGPVEEI